MEIFVILIPILLLLLVGGFLVVTQTTSFLQSNYHNQKQHFSNMLIDRYIEQIIMARNQIYARNKELEVISSKLSLSNEELYKLNEMKSKFLSMVVHDIRTPLASIKGFSELINKNMKDTKTKEYSKNVILASEQLGRLVSDLTDLAMIEAGKLKIEKIEFFLEDILNQIMPGIRINAEKKGVILIEPIIPKELKIYGDKFRLSQVIMNLINNAIKFTPTDKKVEILVGKENRFLLFSVKDSGIGIHPSEIKKIFEKFYQAKHQKDEKLRKQGWGLGLAIAQEIVHAHKGKIWAESPGLGKGSMFSFKIPL